MEGKSSPHRQIHHSHQDSGLFGLSFGNSNTVVPGPVKTPVENMIAQNDIKPGNELWTVYLGSVKDVQDPDKENPSSHSVPSTRLPLKRRVRMFTTYPSTIAKASGRLTHLLPRSTARPFHSKVIQLLQTPVRPSSCVR